MKSTQLCFAFLCVCNLCLSCNAGILPSLPNTKDNKMWEQVSPRLKPFVDHFEELINFVDDSFGIVSPAPAHRLRRRESWIYKLSRS